MFRICKRCGYQVVDEICKCTNPELFKFESPMKISISQAGKIKDNWRYFITDVIDKAAIANEGTISTEDLFKPAPGRGCGFNGRTAKGRARKN